MDIDPKPIDYAKLALGLEYYQSRGYSYIETPWIVSNEATNVTLPLDRVATTTQLGPLVGSAEQGFIELMKRGQEITKACAITPCFRDEDPYDDLHHAYFMKLELINTNATHKVLQEVIADAEAFLGRFLPVKVVKTGKDMYDIVDQAHGLELGSYGFRKYKKHSFVYGTGIALPRLDTVRQWPE